MAPSSSRAPARERAAPGVPARPPAPPLPPAPLQRSLHDPALVEYLCFTPEEFEEMRRGVTIVSEALREGVEV